MHYPETIKAASKIALSALQRMKKLEIVPNPVNFAIWYEYFAGKNQDLKKSVDTLLSTEQAFDERASADIYERFVLAGADSVHSEGFSERIDAIASYIVEALSTSQSDTAEYGEALQTFSGGLANAESLDHIKDLVRDIIEQTDAMDARSKELNRRITDSAEEIRALKKALEDSRRDALTDGLTQIANRKCFDQTLFRTVREANRTGTPLSLIFADLDHFKSFNDSYGHQLGDQVLRLIAKTLHDNVKGRDLVARYGGEEFAVILPDTDTEGATRTAENLLQVVASKKIVAKRSDTGLGTVTISLGVTEYVPGEDIVAFVERADRALYVAKEQGRNQFVCEHPHPARMAAES